MKRVGRVHNIVAAADTEDGGGSSSSSDEDGEHLRRHHHLSRSYKVYLRDQISLTIIIINHREKYICPSNINSWMSIAIILIAMIKCHP